MAKPEKISLLRVVTEYLMIKEILKKDEVRGILNGTIPSSGVSAYRDEKVLRQMLDYVNAVGRMKVFPRGIGKVETFDDFIETLKVNFIKKEDTKNPRDRVKYSENPFDDKFINLVGGMLKMENAEERIRGAINYDSNNDHVAEKISSLPVLLGGKKQSSYIKLLTQYISMYSDISYYQNELAQALENGKTKDATIKDLEDKLQQKTEEFERYKKDVEQLLKSDSKSEDSKCLIVILTQTVENLENRLALDVAAQGRATRKHITRELDRTADRVIDGELSSQVNKIRSQIRRNPNKYRTYVAIIQGKYIKEVDPAYREIEQAAEAVGISKNSKAVEALKNDIHDKNYSNNQYAHTTKDGSTAKKVVGGVIFGALVFGGAAGAIGYSLGNSAAQHISEMQEDAETKAYLDNESEQLDDFTRQLAEAVEQGTLVSYENLENAPTFGNNTQNYSNNTVKDQNYFRDLIEQYSKDDNKEVYKLSSTGEMTARLDAAVEKCRADYYYDNYAKLLSVVSSLNAQIDSLKAELDQANADKAVLQAQVASLQAKIDELNKIIKAAEQENSELRAKVSELQGELDKANARINALENENATLKDENTELKNENERLRAQIDNLSDQIAKLLDQINALKHENSVLSTEKAALQTQVVRYQTQIAQLQAQIDEMNGESDPALQERIAELEAELASAKQQLADAEILISQLRSTNEQLTRDIQNLNNNITNLSSQVSNLEQTVANLTQSNEQLSQENGQLSQENEQLKEENETLKAQIAELRTSLTNSINSYNDLLAKYNELQNNGGNQDEINALRAELNSAYNKIAAYETKIVNLYNSLTKSNTTSQEAMNDLEKLFEIFGINYSDMGTSSYNSSNEYQPGN